MNGKPLIQYPVEAALASGYVDEVWVATDGRCISNAVCDTSPNQKLKVYRRSEASAQDTSNSEDVLLEFSDKYMRHGFAKEDFDIMVFMQCTSPLTETQDIDGALEALEDDTDCSSVLTCCEDHGGRLCGGFIWENLIDEFEIAIRVTPYSHQRQDMRTRYRENGAVYVSYKKDFVREETRLPGRIKIYEMPRSRSFEIDSEEDLEEIRKICSSGS